MSTQVEPQGCQETSLTPHDLSLQCPRTTFANLRFQGIHRQSLEVLHLFVVVVLPEDTPLVRREDTRLVFLWLLDREDEALAQKAADELAGVLGDLFGRLAVVRR